MTRRKHWLFSFMKELFLFVESIKIPRTIIPYLGVIFITLIQGIGKHKQKLGRNKIMSYVKTENGE